MIRDTKLFFLEEDSVIQFGKDEGRRIYAQTAARYENLCNSADYKNNDEIRYHLMMNLFPAMAYYQALLEHGFSKKEALSYVRKETVRAAEIKKAEQAKTAKMPCAYLMYRLLVKSVMKSANKKSSRR